MRYLLDTNIIMSRNLTLVTHNSDEFGRVPGLQVEDWVLAETE